MSYKYFETNLAKNISPWASFRLGPGYILFRGGGGVIPPCQPMPCYVPALVYLPHNAHLRAHGQ